MNRREFLARTAGGAAVAAALAACGDGVFSTGATTVKVPPLPPQPLQITIGDYPQLATIGVLVNPVATYIAVKRTSATTFDAFSMACTHEGFLVNITNGTQFDCPQHGSRFANDGSVLLGPATQALQKLPTSYDQATDKLTIG